MKKIILDLCGGTGSWSKPYKDAGYDVRVITTPEYDVRLWFEDSRILAGMHEAHGILAAPPCTQFSFARTNAKFPPDLHLGMSIVRACLEIIWHSQYGVKTGQKKTKLKFWALENPSGLLKYFLGKPSLEFNPYDFGDDYKKKTHLWGWFNEPKKTPIKTTKPKFDKLKTKEIHPEFYGKLTRTERRAITPQGFAKAFYEANQ